MELNVIAVDGGFKIVAENGTVPAQFKKYVTHIYKHRHVAVARAKKMSIELSAVTN